MTTFFAADHHLGHANIINFTRNDGTKLRPFSSVEEHDEYIVEQHNSVVKQQDIVYLLGDLAIHTNQLKLLQRMNGSLRLVRGNHDIAKLKYYLMNGIRQIHGCKVFTPKDTKANIRIMATHVPVHPNCLGNNVFNIHGHLHYRSVVNEIGEKDNRYKCVSMEHLSNYIPISMEQIVEELINRKDIYHE